MKELDDSTAERFQPDRVAGHRALPHRKIGTIRLPLSRPPSYKPDAKRGKDLFSKRGCLACHSHQAFPDSHATFGPELSRVHSKIRSGKDGHDDFRWVYSWIRDPQRYHKRSKMPNLFLETYEEKGQQIDPAADIAAFLLQKAARRSFRRPRNSTRRRSTNSSSFICRRRCGPIRSPASWTSMRPPRFATGIPRFRPRSKGTRSSWLPDDQSQPIERPSSGGR